MILQKISDEVFRLFQPTNDYSYQGAKRAGLKVAVIAASERERGDQRVVGSLDAAGQTLLASHGMLFCQFDECLRFPGVAIPVECLARRRQEPGHTGRHVAALDKEPIPGAVQGALQQAVGLGVLLVQTHAVELVLEPAASRFR